jgi:hypothetical protein
MIVIADATPLHYLILIMLELHRGLAEGRRDVLAVAPTMSAVNELRNVGFQGR